MKRKLITSFMFARVLSLLVFMSATGLQAQNLCNAHFTHQPGNTLNSVKFLSAPNSSAGLHYSWTFGDGGTSTIPNPVHVYTSPGAYYVCLTVIDSTPSRVCKDTWCDSVRIGITTHPVCNAHFTHNAGNALNSVYFHSSPNPPGTYYSWTFGDGGTSNLPNPNHTYTSPGAYYVCLTVIDTLPSGICKDTWCDSVRIGITTHPVCNAHFTHHAGSTLNSVFFQSSPNPPGTYYFWKFGDGGTSNLPNPNHIYPNGGVYNVCLTVIDSTPNGVCKDTWCDTVRIGTTNHPVCNAHFTRHPGNVPNSVNFMSPPNPPGTQYFWTFGDGGTSTIPNPNHVYTSPGVYYVCLTVKDSTASGVCHDKWCDSVRVGITTHPVCNAHFTRHPGNVPNSVGFHSSLNPPGTHYFWTFGDGGTSNLPNPNHVYPHPGTYYVCLTVIDSSANGVCKDKWCDSVRVGTVSNAICNAHFTKYPGNIPNSVYFKSPINPPGTQYSWTFGDGGTSTVPNPNHIYANPGAYYVCLTVVDSSSRGVCRNTWCDSVRVGVPPVSTRRCNAHFKFYPGNAPPHSVTFISALNPPGTTYSWDFGDGNTSSFSNPAHVYSSSGSYKVCLTVKRPLPDSCTSTWCTLINVHRLTQNGEGDSEVSSVQVYPNPMTEYTTVSLLNTVSPVSFRMYDSTGRLIYKKDNLSDGNFEISNNDLRPGLYFYRVNDDSQMISTGKLVVQ